VKFNVDWERANESHVAEHDHKSVYHFYKNMALDDMYKNVVDADFKWKPEIEKRPQKSSRRYMMPNELDGWTVDDPNGDLGADEETSDTGLFA